MEFEGQQVILTPDEAGATALTSPVPLADLSVERLYAHNDAERLRLDDDRAADDDDLRSWERGEILPRALRLSRDRELIDSMVVQLLEHNILMPSSAENN
jgi:hypothetical protein